MPPRRPGFRYPRGIADLFGQPPRARPSGLVIPPVVPAQIRGAYLPNRMGWAPQVRPIPVIPGEAYTQRVDGVPLTGGQAQGTVPASGTLTLSVGPAGLGTIWTPASLTIQSSLGLGDASTCNVYLAPAGVTAGNLLLGTIFPAGQGTAGFALPVMTPGLYLVAQWTGGTPGTVCTINVVGTMSALAPARRAG